MHCPHKASILTACLFSLALLPALAGAAGPAPAPATAPSERAHIVISASDFRPLPHRHPRLQRRGRRRPRRHRHRPLRPHPLRPLRRPRPRGFLADAGEGVSAASITFRRWVDVGADGLVKVVVRTEGGDLTGELHLYEVRAGREVLSASSTPGPAAPWATG